MRHLRPVLVGYCFVGIFVLSFIIISSHAKDWLGLATPVTEATALTIAAVLATPLVLPLVWERVSKVKLGGVLEFDLVQASAKVDEKLAYELVSVEAKSGALGLDRVPDLTTPGSVTDSESESRLALAIQEAQKTNLIEVNLGTGDSWLSTRLFLLAALVEDYTEIGQMIFLENRPGQDRIFVGSATPATVLQGLAWSSPGLQEAYAAAKRDAARARDAESSAQGVDWIARNTLLNLHAHGGEEALQAWVTTQFLERTLQLNGYCVEWDGGPQTTLFLYQILDRTEPYVPVVRSSGQLHVIVDRVKLAERIAKDSLRQQLDGVASRTDRP